MFDLFGRNKRGPAKQQEREQQLPRREDEILQQQEHAKWRKEQEEKILSKPKYIQEYIMRAVKVSELTKGNQHDKDCAFSYFQGAINTFEFLRDSFADDAIETDDPKLKQNYLCLSRAMTEYVRIMKDCYNDTE